MHSTPLGIHLHLYYAVSFFFHSSTAPQHLTIIDSASHRRKQLPLNSGATKRMHSTALQHILHKHIRLNKPLMWIHTLVKINALCWHVLKKQKKIIKGIRYVFWVHDHLLGTYWKWTCIGSTTCMKCMHTHVNRPFCYIHMLPLSLFF